ncbi:hypothetical protein LshimejAT787_1401460 [Lyophyllum shimeji]|uniref:Uncharacterized protein n=1 Tax=Lyophyllum shimeji TaxID=47721 RepID=A0A9P3PY74_LYOSH|nr:hypothetical protein LshimejAT787_1401460 [Lyophyllum shimeji]
MLAILLLAIVVPCAFSLGVIAPLYYDPLGDCSRWAPISSAVSDHSAIPFYLVINPDDGPGAAGSQPDPSYDACVPNLRPASNSNAIVLGYVNLSSKAVSSALVEIDTYAGWSSTSRPTGIFFDSTTADSVTEYQSLVSHAREKGFNFIAMDPGEPPHSDYYSLADLINTYESSYANFKSSDLVITSSTPASKQSVILSKAPTSGSYSAVLSQIASLGLAAVYITDLSTSVSGIPKQWSSFVHNVAVVRQASPDSMPVSSPSLSGQTSAPANKPTNTLSGASFSQTPSSGAATTAKSAPAGAIVGGVLGAIVVILLVLFFMLWRRRKRLSQSDEAPIDPFLSRQPFTTLIQPLEKHPSDATGTSPSETEPGSSLSRPTVATNTTPSSASQPSPASNFAAGARGISEKRRGRASVAAASHRATISHRDSFDRPPSYHAESPV